VNVELTLSRSNLRHAPQLWEQGAVTVAG
jgi:hypothetical protein